MQSIENMRKHIDQATDHEMVLASMPPQHRVVTTAEKLYELCDEIEMEVAEKYIKLPVDADGEPIHLGDYVVQARKNPLCVSTIRGEVVQIRRPTSGWMVEVNTGTSLQELYHKSIKHLRRQPTTEDVLTEFTERYDLIPDGDEGHAEFLDLLAEFAEKLQLKPEEGEC